MKSLQELIRFVTSRQPKDISALPAFGLRDKNSRYKMLADGILEGKFATDEEAATTLYGEGGKTVKYRVLKSRLRDQLYNSVLLFYTDRQKKSASEVQAAIYRQLIIAKILLGAGVRAPGFELLDKVLTSARANEFFDIVAQCAIHFRRRGMMQGDINSFRKYNTLFRQAHNYLWYEAEAEELYSEVMIHFNESFAQQPSLIAQTKQSAEKLAVLREKNPTFLIHYYTNSIQSTYYYLIRDYKNAISCCEEYETYLLQNPLFYTPQRHAVILSEKAGYYLHIHDFENGIFCATQALALYKEGSTNWFLLLELYFLLVLNKGDLEKATAIYIQVITHTRFEYARPQQQELWKIFGGYLWFIAAYEKNTTCINALTSRGQIFRFSKLMNEIPHFSRDKKGMNVAVLILQVLLLLQKKEYIAVISRTENLKSYIYRNLDKEAHRSHIFIKMLLIMEKNQFDAAKINHKTKTLLARLKEGDLNYTTTQARMEIIPYEQLWQIVLNLIK